MEKEGEETDNSLDEVEVDYNIFETPETRDENTTLEETCNDTRNQTAIIEDVTQQTMERTINKENDGVNQEHVEVEDMNVLDTTQADVTNMEAKSKFAAKQSQIMSHLIDMGTQSIIDFKNKEAVLERSLRIQESEEEEELQRLQSRNEHLRLCIEEQKKNLLIVENNASQLEKEQIAISKLVKMLMGRWKQLENMFNSLHRDKASFSGQPDEHRQLFKQYVLGGNKTIEALEEGLRKIREEQEREEAEFRKQLEEQNNRETELKTKIELIQKQIKCVSARIKSTKESNEGKEQLLQEVKGRYEDAKKSLQAISESNSDLEEERKIVKEECASRKQNVTKSLEEAKSKLENLRTHRKNLQEETNNIRNKINDLQGVGLEENASLKEEYEALKTVYEGNKKKYKEECDEAELKCKGRAEEFKKLIEEATAVTEVRNGHVETLKSLEIREKELEERLNTCNFVLKHEEEKKKRRIEKINEYKEKLSLLGKEKETTHQTLEEKLHLLEKLSQKLRSQREEFQRQISDARENLQKVQKESEEKIELLKDETANRKIELEKISALEEEQLRGKIGDLQEHLQKLREERLILSGESESLTTKLHMQKDYIGKLKAQFQKLQAIDKEKKASKENKPPENKPSGILKSPGSKTASKKVSFQQSLLWDSDNPSQQSEKLPLTSEELFEALLKRNSPPERLVQDKKK